MKIVQIKNKLILIICLFSYANAFANDLLNKLIANKESYFIVDIDINKDGVLDKVISSKPYKGDELYFFEKINGIYKLVYKGQNFSEDGGNIIDEIKSISLNNSVINISTIFPDRGYFVTNYMIEFKNDTWYLNDIIYQLGYFLDYDERLDECLVKKDIRLVDIIEKNIQINVVPEEKERDKKCNIHFNIKSSLNDFIHRIKTDAKDKYLTTQRYMSLLNKYPLTIQTLIKYNDIAYYLQQANANDEAIFLLEKIIEKFPNRTVAYLNLADSYAGKGESEKAKQNYEKYISLMKQDDKESKIPQRVLEYK